MVWKFGQFIMKHKFEKATNKLNHKHQDLIGVIF